MTNPLGRTSENTLFSLLIAAFIGWMALSAVSGPAALSTASEGAVAQAVAAHDNS
ncbi:MAG TPA: hypothetical protein VH278_05430 [Burkholderiaceae bacterium]|jgi:hypothetical protein|nr:hypothetical protein [Burkholderiaceae bacterium]